ncbi:RNA-directed DNA polymerase, eukaryota [Tanacetum coccineum]|uniref:RNA-directed DNA polymerase, eukaryota n=1 Tax=Tanacetum coccineum TaxID=301880 RepID=A0ABQ5FX54_9ASTR
MVFKIDFAKAYDSIRWDYLGDVLKSFGFGVKWCSWIRGILNSSMASILVNGSPTKEFQFHRGLKQGIRWLLIYLLLSHGVFNLTFTRLSKQGIFPGPYKAVLKSMESIRRNFFNGIRDGEKKIAWVSWSKVLASKSNGGLGVSSFYALNRGLHLSGFGRLSVSHQSFVAPRSSCMTRPPTQVLFLPPILRCGVF